MSITLKIKVTKDCFIASRYCTYGTNDEVPENCAIALAVRDIFPKAKVWGSNCGISPFGEEIHIESTKIIYPSFVAERIKEFDHSSARERVRMTPFEFDVEIPDAVIEKINIEELKPLLENHPTLQLV